MTTQDATQIQQTASEKLKQQMEELTMGRAERKQQRRARENALPFAKRTTWRTRHMYRGWMLETVELRHEPVGGSSPFAITRSNYGYRVLNTPDLGIIDVDFDFYCGISEIHVVAQRKEAIANLREWVESHPEQSWRIYGTAAGLRMMRTDEPQPLDDSYDAVCNAIDGADNLYRELCKEQNAFRARISPKVARIGCEYPSWSPYEYEHDGWGNGKAPTQEDIFVYEMTARSYKTAELLEVIGSGAVHPSLGWTLRYHDDSCRVDSSTLLMERPVASEYVLLASMPELIAFNDVYRPNGWAPDQVWDSLDGVTRRDVRYLGGCRDRVIAAYERLDGLAHKYSVEFADYKEFDTLYQPAFAKYKEDAKQYTWENGHWQSSEESVFRKDPRYWQLENPIASATTSAVIRFLPSHDSQRCVQRQALGVMKYYVSNILVVNDPKYPANNGKVFLFRYGFTIDEKIKDMTDPPREFADMISIDPWDMKTGGNLNLRAVVIDGAVNLDKSSFDESSQVGDDAAMADLLMRVYSLDEA